MFYEYACGCILSRFQGRVRICPTHRPAKTWPGGPRHGMGGDGGMESTWVLRHIVAVYPANGEVSETDD